MMIYLQNIIEGLEYLGSYEFQKTAWFENDQGLSSCFAEDVEAVFMDTGLEDAFKEKKIVFGKDIDEQLRELEKMSDAVGYKRLDSELIDAPDMQAVREKANQILALIKAIGKQYPFVAEL